MFLTIPLLVIVERLVYLQRYGQQVAQCRGPRRRAVVVAVVVIVVGGETVVVAQLTAL